MNRSRKMVLVSHCILNSNAKVEGLSSYRGIIKELVDMIHRKDLGIFQLPCPEMTMYGIKRWGHVKEQFDIPFFRENCRDMLKPIVQQIKAYIDGGYQVLGVIGIDGSPSCGVDSTCSGDFKGELSNNPKVEDTLNTLKMIHESGVFMEELKAYFREFNINIPFIGLDESDVDSSMDKMRVFFDEK